MMNSTYPVRLSFEPAFLEAHLDEIVVRLEVDCFPLLKADVESGVLLVDGAFDPDPYSALMAATDALTYMGQDVELLYGAEEV